MIPPADERSRIKVIARAAAVLRALAAFPKGATLSEIATEVGLPRSTAHRILAALGAEDLVTISQHGRLKLGPGLIRLAAAEHLDVRTEVRPHLEALSTQLGETVDLAVLKGDSVLFLDQVSAPQRLLAVSSTGSVFPAHCTANGKALLAELPLSTVQQLLPSRLPARTPNTIRSRAKLEQELRDVRRNGFAVDREEHTVGICAVGISIRDAFGTEMAITVPLPTQRFKGRENEIPEALLGARATIEQALGTDEG